MNQLAPVTLVVKAPNQKIEDRRVACDKNWTVRQLKRHLSTVYPEQPTEDQQKLVYYGKLLKDDSQLHEVLTHETFEDAHTVHLVCPQHSSAKPAASCVPQAQFVSADTLTEPCVPQNSEPQTEGIRNRFPLHYSAYGSASQFDQQLTCASQLSPQQKLWLQAHQQQQWWIYQTHLQQMAALNQLAAGHQSEPATQPAQQNVAGGNGAGVNGADDEAVQMNAQGGVEAGVGQRDWLDKVYSLFRFSMITSLFYFYTTIGRFFAVCGIALFFYFAQGNLRLQRRRINRGPEAVPPEAENRAENQNDENSERPNTDTDESDSPTTPQPPVANTLEWSSAGLNFMRSIFSFIFSFFVSLVPQQPEIPAN